MPACKKCGEPIVWNHQDHEETGKWRPFDEETDQPHDCPNNDWEQGSGGSRGGDGSNTRLENKMEEVRKTMLQILSAIQTLQIRVEGLMPLFPTSTTAVEVEKPIHESETVALSEADNEDAASSGGKESAGLSP
jgi:hypothetical protein